MKVLNSKTRLTGFVAMFACAVMASAVALRADGNLKMQATTTLVNPCNGETVTGLVDVLLGVHANSDGHVKVHRSFHGTLEGNQGNTYQVRTLADGSTHHVLKNFPSEVEMRSWLADQASDVRWHAWPHYWALEYTLAGAA